jgi:hypothetical protein
MLAQLRALRLADISALVVRLPNLSEGNLTGTSSYWVKISDKTGGLIQSLILIWARGGVSGGVEMSPGAVNLRQKQMQKLLLDESNNTI